MDGQRPGSFQPGSGGYRTMADIAYDTLRDRIVTGVLPAGERIDQDAEAERLQASRMPIREALRRLEAEGLVDIVRHRGVVVRSLSVDDLEDLYVMRLALECVAARLGVAGLAQPDLDAMRQLLPEMDDVVARQDAVAWLDIDWAFHEILYRAAQRPRLLRTIHGLREEARRYRTVGLSLPRVLEVSLQEHRLIIMACEQRNGEEVERLIRSALERTRSELRQMLEHRLSPADRVAPA